MKLVTPKMKTQEKVGYKLINTVLYITVIVFAITVTFLHEYFPKKSKEYIEHYPKHSLIIKQRNAELNDILEKLGNKTISSDEYILAFENIKKTSNSKLNDFEINLKRIKQNDSFIGYTSFKNFLLGVGFPLCGFILSLFFLSVVVNNIPKGYKYKFNIGIAFAFNVCWGYWLIWSFYNKLNSKGEYDFEHWVYNIMLFVLLPIIIFLLSYFLFKHHQTIEKKLMRVIHAMSRFMIKDAKKHIKPESIVDYKNDYVNALKEGKS